MSDERWTGEHCDLCSAPIFGGYATTSECLVAHVECRNLRSDLGGEYTKTRLIAELEKRGQHPRAGAVTSAMLDLYEDERLAVMALFCSSCGRADPGCRCWDDS